MNCEIKTLEVKPDDVIVIKFNIKETPIDEINEFFQNIVAYFPNNKVVGIPNDAVIKTETAEKVIKYLQGVAK